MRFVSSSLVLIPFYYRVDAFSRIRIGASVRSRKKEERPLYFVVVPLDESVGH